jgi:hypothetical protein
MPVKIIYKNRRSGSERRKRLSTHNGNERRGGVDRRKLDEKLKQMIENNIKDQDKEGQKAIQTSSGNVILRRKGGKGKPPPE